MSARKKSEEHYSTMRVADEGSPLNVRRPRSPSMLSTVLIVVLLLLLIGALPTWPYSSGWGYGPGGIVGAVLAIVVVMALIGRL